MDRATRLAAVQRELDEAEGRLSDAEKRYSYMTVESPGFWATGSIIPKLEQKVGRLRQRHAEIEAGVDEDEMKRLARDEQVASAAPRPTGKQKVMRWKLPPGFKPLAIDEVTALSEEQKDAYNIDLICLLWNEAANDYEKAGGDPARFPAEFFIHEIAVLLRYIRNLRQETGGDLHRALEARVTEIEQSLPTYRGVWKAGETYPKNSIVTEDGSMWVALADSIGLKPGTGPAGAFWQLSCKRGRDGKDGERGPRGLPGGTAT